MDFPGVRALDDVHFSVKEGEIHCLVGENGAGKSTLMKIISGVYPHGTYTGSVQYKSRENKFTSVKDSENEGIAIIHQELALSPYLSIAENIFLGHQHSRYGTINVFKQHDESKRFLLKVGLEEDPNTIVNTVGVGKQQLVEIAKALSKESKIIIFDEPTASLNDQESDNLLNLILSLKEQGITCIMISHKLAEVLKIADSITVLRDGKTVAFFDTSVDTVDEALIIKNMVGREMENRFPHRVATVQDEVVLEVKNWSVYHPLYSDKKVVEDASLKVRRGEIVGLCGLMGSGRTELMMSIFGRSYGSHQEGELFIHGKRMTLTTPKNAFKAGLAYVSEDRKDLGLVLIQDVKTNITNSNFNACADFGVLKSAKVEKAALNYREKLRIRTPTVHTVVNNLSGGNQQKVVLSRCLYASPDILIVDEPTRGIDVGAKYEIYQILGELVSQGKSIIMISSELIEVLGMSDRIYIMNSGLIKGEMNARDATEESIMEVAIR